MFFEIRTVLNELILVNLAHIVAVLPRGEDSTYVYPAAECGAEYWVVDESYASLMDRILKQVPRPLSKQQPETVTGKIYQFAPESKL